ncbi:TonB-dependent hemoglobin/transferrin/lactoferrin family receptor [Ketogulonicigenium vulgare]|uniref:Heme receptor-like protein n=1 Tax=Ketogulonicigenium vulgare (strain WSH-001) TaxID=759362 RepID=F9Y5K0_KETVW|nr:TonB-dependent hemoglobin/transferrin/lactoferrin family receptor [Ketogulonicigenium vulgare]ADO42558.1 heme acquisition protein hasR [Ketogulonicigenium vulgare Y25]AEM40753.1 Heme receptor-like protein [Ketogulonicigenium vulgare WSH-001]ALJ80922.1 heme transporter CcmC [Ketogulonicigenium vulgare]ANW33693.1 TonB-dependent heme/hemoglobin receptor family protein [Ketogulonicigenium vulgare]AOZ54471.1 heme acquisition protein hasR [Ketogulonicigenium vulgare]
MHIISMRGMLRGAVALCALTVPALAQDTTTSLGTIVISDLRTEQTALQSLTGVSAVTSEDLERQQAASVADVLRRVPGVGATASGDDASVAVNLRGMQQMGRVVVTVDGARQDFWRVGHGSGSFYLDPDLLKQVTVVRGPASNTYGSGGIGGVVAFETRDASDMLAADETWAYSQRLRYGSNGEGFSTTATGAMRFGQNFDVISSLSYRNSDEYRDGNGDLVRWTGEEIQSGFGKATWRPAEGHELKFSFMRQITDDVISGSSGSMSSTLSRYETETYSDTYTLSYGYDPLDSDLIDFTIRAYHASNDNDQSQVWPTASIGNSRYYDVATTGLSFQNTARINAGGWDQTVVLGGDFARIEASSDADHFGGGEQEIGGVFGQWQGRHGAWELIGALRYDHYSLEGMTKATPTAASEPASLSGNRWSPRVSVGYDIMQGMQVFATYSEGYRSPHLQETFRRNGAHGAGYEPNLTLRPEIAKSWEIGANMEFASLFSTGDLLTAKVTAFHTDVQDYIETARAASGATTHVNVGNATLEGFEIEGSYDFGAGYFNLAGAFVDATLDDTGATLSNTPLDSVTARLGLRAMDDRLEYGVEYQYLGDVTRVLSTGSFDYPAVDLVNLFASYQAPNDWRVDFGVDNLFDKAYTDPQSGWATTTDIEQGRGRTVRIAFTKRLGG